MTPTLRVVLIVVSILTTFMIMRKIRQSKLQIEDSIFWLGFSSILIVFSIFPGLPDLLAEQDITVYGTKAVMDTLEGWVEETGSLVQAEPGCSW